MAIATTNPSSGKTIRTFDELTGDELDRKVQRAADRFAAFRSSTWQQRASTLRRAADILEHEARSLAELATLEMGKTLSSAVSEVHKCALACRWYADHAREYLADERYDIEGATVFTRYEPLGPVLAVMPWNFPYWQVFRFLCPALMAGNVCLLKHASNVPQVAMAIEDVLRRAGFAEGAFQTLLIGSARIPSLIGDDRIAGVTLTGSEGAGREVGGTAGKNLKVSVLELGGSDAFIVMPSANLDEAVPAAITSRTLNNGQSCINAKRFIVHEQVAERFTRDLVTGMRALRVGDPMDPDTDIGPLSSQEAVDTLDHQVRDTVKRGARVLAGGTPLSCGGSFYPPTVLSDIPRGSPGHREELFGPVALLWTARDIDQAIGLANDSRFGLGGSAWTREAEEQRRFVTEIDTGMIYINKFTASTPEVPFGGTKDSGYGRELAQFGARSFTNPKTVWVAH